MGPRGRGGEAVAERDPQGPTDVQEKVGEGPVEVDEVEGDPGERPRLLRVEEVVEEEEQLFLVGQGETQVVGSGPE